MEVREDDEEFKNPVDLMFDALEAEKPNHFAVRQYKKYKLAAGKTAKSILISCGARLAVFDIAELREVTAYDELELDTLGDRKTALFLIMSDTDDSFNFLISMCYTQLFNLLCEKADDVYGGRLPDVYKRQVRAYVKDNFVDKGMCADFAIHDKGTGNPHVHIMLTLRPLKENGQWGAKCRKAYDLNENGQRIPDRKGGWKNHREDTTDWNDKGNVEIWRAAWAAYTNRALESAGRPERIDHRSYKRQGIDKIPSVHPVSYTHLDVYKRQELVSVHKGTITAASIPGAGTTFTIMLPKAL